MGAFRLFSLPTTLISLLPLSVSAAESPKVELLCKEHNSGENHVIVMPLEDAKHTDAVAEGGEQCFITDTVDEDTLTRLIGCHFEYETGGNNYMRQYAVKRKTGEMKMKYFETDTGVYLEQKFDCQKVVNKF